MTITLDEIAEKMRSQLTQESTISAATLQELKKCFDELKNSLNTGTVKVQESFPQKEKVIGLLLRQLDKGQLAAKEKIFILQILEKELISTKENVKLFNVLYGCLKNDDEIVAIQASKTIDSLIKQVNEAVNVTAGAVLLETRLHYIPLFEFLKDKTEFLLRLSDHTKDSDFKPLRKQTYQEREKEKKEEKDKKEVVLKNTKSLKFINQVPHLFIHLMAYVDINSRTAEDQAVIKECIRKSIENIVKALRETPYDQFYHEFNYDFNNELFGVMTKLLQFLFINLRSEKEQSSSNKSSINLKKHINDQIEHIRVPQVIKNFIYLLKNCSQDFQLNRQQISNRLKLLLNNLDKSKLSRPDALEIMGEILNEETIFGRKKVTGDYFKNTICSLWLEMIRSPVLLTNVFPTSILSVRAVSQASMPEDSPEITQCFAHIDRLIEEVLKIVFDNNFYPTVQEKCLELITYLIEQLFPEGSDQVDNLSFISSCPAAKRIQELKLRVLVRTLDCAALKFLSIRNVFEEIDTFVTKKLGRKVTKRDIPEPNKFQYMQQGQLQLSLQESKNWQEEVVDFIEKRQQDIDGSLLTVKFVRNKFISIYEEEDELCFNSHPVRMSNYTIYMRQIKTQVIEKCINLSHRITRTFLAQNLDAYTQLESNSLRAIYFMTSSKKALTDDQCRILSSILKNGLKIYQLLHIYDIHSDDQVNKRGHLKNFMLIFAQVYDPVNFRDIFEPNMDHFFKNLITYAKHCADYCLQFVLIEPYCSNNQQQQFNKNIVELLTYNLILRLESTSDQLDPFHDFYEYKQQYFLLLQKLIRFPFRCLSRYADESFIRNYFRQIILFLTKKAHTSNFCLDYLHLMRTLFKNILFNQSRESPSPLYAQFYAICCRNPPPNSQSVQPQAHSVFVNVNILDNFLRFFETGIPELADIVTELVIMLPLKSKHIIQFAKQGYIVKPLLHCLCLMSDYNYLLRTLKTFEIIISHSTAEQIGQFLHGLAPKLIQRLLQIVHSEYKPADLKPDKINNDLSSLSLKLLAKLGALSRNRDLPLQLTVKSAASANFFIHYTDQHGSVNSMSMDCCVDYALEIFHKLLDSYYQSIIFISMELIEKSFALLVEVLPLALSCMNELSDRILAVFAATLSLSSKYLTISPSILTRIREEVTAQIRLYVDGVKRDLRKNGLTQYSKFFIKALVNNLQERVLITREEIFIKEISQEPKKFLWGLLINIIECVDGQMHLIVCEQIMRLLISASVAVCNPHTMRLNAYHKDYNHILPFKNAALSALSELIDKAPLQVLENVYADVLDAAFMAVLSLPDILNLKIMKHPRTIARKIYKFILRNEEDYLANFSTTKGQRVFKCILQNLASCSIECHEIAMQFLEMVMNESNLKLHELLYGNTAWENLRDGGDGMQFQSKYSLHDFSSHKEPVKYPVVQLIKSLIKIVHNVSDDTLRNNSKSLKMLHNCFSTFTFLISVRHKGNTYQMFQILTREDKSDAPTDDSSFAFQDTFRKIIGIAQEIIIINDKLYDNFTKIIIEQSFNAPNFQQGPQHPNRQNRPELPRAREQPPAAVNGVAVPVAPVANNQTFIINASTFIDDEEYGLNIEDLDVEIRIWGRLMASILRFLKSVLLSERVFQISRSLLKQKVDSKIIETRLNIIFTMFELIGRVDKSVRKTAYECLQEMLGREEHPKDLIQNDEKLKHILRPVLISLQLQFKRFTPSFLHMFKNILKLLTQCFNITLIQKLVEKLREMEKVKESEISIQAKLPNPTQPQSTRHLNYSEITLETKCIGSFLGLFQHLAYAYHNQRSYNYTVNSIILIFKYVSSICNFFTHKLGKHTIKIYIKKTLAKVLNTMCEKLTGESIFVEGRQDHQLDIEHFLELIRLEESFSLREKFTRETAYIEKAFTDYAKNKSKRDYFIFIEVIYVFAKHNSRWLKNYTSFADKLIKELNEAVNSRVNAGEGSQLVTANKMRQFESNEKNQILLLSKILLAYVRENPEELKAFFSLVSVFKLRSTFDFNFIRQYFKYELYDHTTPETKRKIMLEFLSMLRNVESGDVDKIIAISQNIIYHFILIEVNAEESKRCILINNQEFLKSLIDTLKTCLITNFLHSRHTDPKIISSNYRVAIEVLQISNLSLGTLKKIMPDAHRHSMLQNVWAILRMEDKIIKNYAFVWASNYIRLFENFEANKALGIYLILIKSLQSLSQGDYQIASLIKKSLNILIPYWDAKTSMNPGTNNPWIDWSLKAVHEETNQPNKLVRFWEIVVKNHTIFQTFKNRFETQMVNSMQWLMVANNPTSSNPLVKKIASDMSFIYIDWKFKEAKARLLESPPAMKLRVLEEIAKNDKAADICLNFFIKVALNNSSDKDDKQIMKRSLFLLKQTLILWPSTKKKFEVIKMIVNKLKSSSVNVATEIPLRFHYTLLNIINILMMYESDQKLKPQLLTIFKLLELNGNVSLARFAGNAHPAQIGITIFTMNNIYLLHLLCSIVQRLLKIAFEYENEEESARFIEEVRLYIQDGLESHVMTVNRARVNPPVQPARANVATKKIELEVTICFLKILFDVDSRGKSIEPHLNHIKQVTSIMKKAFEKNLEPSKSTSPSRVYELPVLNEGSFTEMLQKNLQISVELIKPDKMASVEENYEKENIKSYATRRPLFVILLRILAAKFNSISHSQDQSNVLDIFMSIYDKIPDPELKVEVINLFKCLFIGRDAWPDGVPQHYSKIDRARYSPNKVFHLLFEDCNKFNQHFEKRKSKPSDQNYNINERIYEEITTKLYFNFLCQYLANFKDFEPTFLDKIKIFVLYCIKLADDSLLEQVFIIIDRAYDRFGVDIYTALFEDYRDMSCAEENLQGDEIALFFTYYLYTRAVKKHTISVSAFNQLASPSLHNHFIHFLKADVASPFYAKGLNAALKLALSILPHSKKLPRIINNYLVHATYNDQWGSILLHLALDLKCLNHEELFTVTTRIGEWGLLLKQLEEPNVKSDSLRMILDYAYRAYGDKDLVYGYRLMNTRNLQLQQALCSLQQRNYVRAMQHVAEYHQSLLKRSRPTERSQFKALEDLLDNSLTTDITKECYKNLGKWEELSSVDCGDPIFKMDYLFHAVGNASKMNSVMLELEKCAGQKEFAYFYGRSVINFMESSSSQNRQLNVSLLYALLEWLSFPKNARLNQNELLVKIECLVELEEGEKIKEESLSAPSVNEQPICLDSLTKVVQSVYAQINCWRERMPDKSEDPSVWHAILGQRMIIYDFMKAKMFSLLEKVQSTHQNHFHNSPTSQKLLLPYSDIEWNHLNLIKNQRYFSIFNGNSGYASNSALEQLSIEQDQVFVREKEKFYEVMIHQADDLKSLQALDNALAEISKDHKDEESFKIQKIQIARLKTKLYLRAEQFDAANSLFMETIKGQDQHLLPLWRDWMMLSIRAYQKTKKWEWACSAIATLPYALRYKPQKTKLLLASIMSILANLANDENLVETLSGVIQYIPIKPLMLWLPEMVRLADSRQRVSEQMSILLSKLAFYYPQTMCYFVRSFFKNQESKVFREIYIAIKKVYFNLVGKIFSFSDLLVNIRESPFSTIPIQIMGSLSRSFAELHIPLYETYRASCEAADIPTVAQVSQVSDMFQNGDRTLSLLGSDGKEYKYRLEKDMKTPDNASLVEDYEQILFSQTCEMINCSLGQWREALSRKLKYQEKRKLTLFNNLKEMKIQRIHHNVVNSKLILQQYLKSIGQDDPTLLTQFLKLPKGAVDKAINTHMKTVVPDTLLRDYLVSCAATYDEFLSFRRVLSSQYGVAAAVNYVMSFECGLSNQEFYLQSGKIAMQNMKLNRFPPALQPFALRLSRNYIKLFGPIELNAGILPAFTATIHSLHNQKLNFKSFLNLVYDQMERLGIQVERRNHFQKVEDINANPIIVRKIIEVAQKIAHSDEVPSSEEYWF